MTVESTIRKQTFAGGQANLTFAFRTLVSHPEFIKVNKTLLSTGVDTPLVYNTDYTVSLLADGSGGTVVVSPTMSTAYSMTVYRSTDDLQESDYDDFNQFPADTLEGDLDRRTLISQERSDDVSRTAKLPISYTGSAITLPNPLDGYSLIWSGGTLINSNLTGSTGAIGPTGPAGPSGGSVSVVSSSTSDITVASGSTTPILTLVKTALLSKIKAVSFTYDLTSTSGTQTITGVGFTPKALIAIGGTSNVSGGTLSIGIADSSISGDGFIHPVAPNITSSIINPALLDIYVDQTNGAEATVSSFNADGFVLAWAKAGSPTGTATIKVLCIG